MNMLEKLKSALDKLDNKTFPHGSNLRTKINSSSLTPSQRQVIRNLAPAYLSIIKSGNKHPSDFDNWLASHTVLVDNYVKSLRSSTTQEFSHQSDLISSVIPEYLCCILKQVIKSMKLKLEVIGQTNLMIELVFSQAAYGQLHGKYKRVDAAIIIPTKLIFRGENISKFKIPVIATEVKTNLDKNMITGIDNSVSSLKNTFPLCKYFVVSEFADFQFEKQNYANTDIDEVYILRKQKRSLFRQTGHLNDISIDIVRDFIERVIKGLQMVGIKVPDIDYRMSKGRLINWR